MFYARFAISTYTARYGRYIPVRQFAGTRTARYRAVPPKIDRRRSISAVDGRFRPSTVDFGRQRPIEGEIDRRQSISTVDGRLREKKKKRKRRKKKRRKRKPSTVLVRAPSPPSPTCRRRLQVARALSPGERPRPLFLPHEGTISMNEKMRSNAFAAYGALSNFGMGSQHQAFLEQVFHSNAVTN
ncbi:hypothetical protein GW17_00008025 [Ensete ventricosum]|nr:hypothetical protein GW17_00008025 [Ensete ventricosum]